MWTAQCREIPKLLFARMAARRCLSSSSNHLSRSAITATMTTSRGFTKQIMAPRFGIASGIRAFSSRPLTINDTFPNLKGKTQFEDGFDLYDYLGDDSWGVVFMHPADFTPVCTTELGEAVKRKADFESRNVKMCGFSCSSAEEHLDWSEDIKYVTGCGDLDYPLFADPTRDLAVQLGILDETNKDAAGLPLTVRSVFILKPDKSIALMMTYPASTGRNFDEIIRCIDSLQRTASKMVATPVNWKPGDDVIVNFPLTNAMADEQFGADGYKVIDVPSERGKGDLEKNYMRVTADPSK